MAADGPLAGRRVLVPRAEHQAAALSDRIRALGGDPVEAPTISIEAGDEAALDAAVRTLAEGGFVAVCLTSPNGVAALAASLSRLSLDAGAAFSDVGLVACVGPGTAAAFTSLAGRAPDLVPSTATTAALGSALPAGRGRVLLARADLADPAFAGAMSAKGYEPVEVVAYRTRSPAGLPQGVLDDLEAGRVDLLPFASPSQVRNFATLVGERPWRGRVVSIGPVTSAACREQGIAVAVEATAHDLDGLVAALVVAAG